MQRCICDVDRAVGANMSRAVEGLSAQEKYPDRIVTVSISCLCAGSSLEHARATMHGLPRRSIPMTTIATVIDSISGMPCHT